MSFKNIYFEKSYEKTRLGEKRIIRNSSFIYLYFAILLAKIVIYTPENVFLQKFQKPCILKKVKRLS